MFPNPWGMLQQPYSNAKCGKYTWIEGPIRQKTSKTNPFKVVPYKLQMELQPLFQGFNPIYNCPRAHLVQAWLSVFFGSHCEAQAAREQDELEKEAEKHAAEIGTLEKPD